MSLLHAIGIKVDGVNALAAPLSSAKQSLLSFQKQADETARSVNAALAVSGEVDTAAIRKAGDDLTGMGRKGMMAGAVVSAGLGFAASRAMAFETAMSEVSTLVDTNTTDMVALTTEVKSLAGEFGQMPVDTAKAMYTTISAGFGEAADATQLMRGSMALARGGIASLDTSIDGLTSILNSYGLSAGRTTDISDMMFIAMREGKTTVGALAASMGDLTPLSSAAGAGIGETLAAISALTLGGLKTNKAVTSLKGVFTAVMKPTAEAAKEADRLGLSFNTQAIQAMGLSRWLSLVGEKTDGDSDSLAKLFGNVEGLTAMLALGGAQADTFSRILGEMDERSGATATAVAKIDKTAGASFEKMRAGVDNALISVGDALLPALGLVAAVVAKASNAFSSFADNHQTLVGLTVGIVGVSTALLVVGSIALMTRGYLLKAALNPASAYSSLVQVLTFVKTGLLAVRSGALAMAAAFQAGGIAGVMATLQTAVVSAWAAVVPAFSSIGAAASAAWTAITGPIGLIVMGTALVGAAIYAIEQKTGVFGKAWTAIWGVVKGAFMGVATSLAYGVGYLAGQFENAWEAVSRYTESVWPYLATLIGGAWTAITSLLLPEIALVKGVFVAAWGLIRSLTVATWDTIALTVSSAWKLVSSTVAFFWTAISGMFKVGLQLLTGDWSGAWDTVEETSWALFGNLQGIFGSMMDWFRGLGTIFWDLGLGFIQAIWGGIQSAWGTIVTGLSGLFGDLPSILSGDENVSVGVVTTRADDLANPGNTTSAVVSATGKAAKPTTRTAPKKKASSQAKPARSAAPSSASWPAPRLATRQTVSSTPKESRPEARSQPPIVFRVERGAVVIRDSQVPMQDLEEQLLAVLGRIGVRLGGSA